MRGGVSLAAALAIPLETDAGAPFPERDLIIFLAFCVILATLVGQGLLFPALIHMLRVEDDGLDADEELNARLEIAFAALDRIDELEDVEWVPGDTVEARAEPVQLPPAPRSRRASTGAAPVTTTPTTSTTSAAPTPTGASWAR